MVALYYNIAREIHWRAERTIVETQVRPFEEQMEVGGIMHSVYACDILKIIKEGAIMKKMKDWPKQKAYSVRVVYAPT